MAYNGPESAWMVQEWLSGKTLNAIGKEIGIHGSSICSVISTFLQMGRYKNEPEIDGRLHSYQRRELAQKILRRWVSKKLQVRKPPRRDPTPWLQQGGDYSWARHEHVYMLRQEGFTLKLAGIRVGVNAERARQMEAKFIRRLKRAFLKRTTFTIASECSTECVQ